MKNIVWVIISFKDRKNQELTCWRKKSMFPFRPFERRNKSTCIHFFVASDFLSWYQSGGHKSKNVAKSERSHVEFLSDQCQLDWHGQNWASFPQTSASLLQHVEYVSYLFLVATREHILSLTSLMFALDAVASRHCKRLNRRVFAEALFAVECEVHLGDCSK